jgi:hypothetical protein
MDCRRLLKRLSDPDKQISVFHSLQHGMNFMDVEGRTSYQLKS